MMLTTAWNALALTLFLSSSFINGQECSFEETELVAGILTLRHATNVADRTVTMEMIYNGEGYLGVGFGTRMAGSTAVIGIPGSGENPNLVFMPTLSQADMVAAEDASALLSSSIIQEDGVTTMAFTLSLELLTSSNVVTDGANSVIYAYGSSNTFTHHLNRGIVPVSLVACGSSGVPESDAGNEPTEAVFDNSPKPAVTPTVAPEPTNIFELEPGLTVLFETDLERELLYVEMVYEGQAWISIGFSEYGGMVDSTAVMAMPDEPVSASNPGLWFLGGKTTSTVTRLPEDRQGLLDATMTQNDTHTTMSFYKRFVEEGVVDIVPDGENSFIYAYGSGNALGSHPSRSSLTVNLGNLGAGIETGPEPKRELWEAHGVLMALAWGIMIPIGIGCSMIREILPLAPGTWYQIHSKLNSFAYLLVVIGLALAVRALNEEAPNGVEVEHFTFDIKHRGYGLIITIFAFLQVLSGLLRPHAPHKPKPKEEKDDDKEGQEQPDVKFNEEEKEAEHDDGHDHSKKTPQRFLWEIQHRFMGLGLIGLSWYNIDEGLTLFAQRFSEDEINGAFWGFVGGLSGLIAVGVVVQNVQKLSA